MLGWSKATTLGEIKNLLWVEQGILSVRPIYITIHSEASTDLT